MADTNLRIAFLNHVGSDTFRRFALQLRRDATHNPATNQTVDRLRFWQSKIWEEFNKTQPDATNDIREIRESLLWCDIHELRLSEGRAIRDTLGITDRDGTSVNADFQKALNNRFPFGFGFWTLICDGCVVECKNWMATTESNNRQNDA